jgi:two-component system cell cycle response regulator DivK
MSNPIHALLIDDDPFNLEVLQRFLTQEGITCNSLQNIKTISSVMASIPRIDLVFLDLEMPQTNGYEVFQLLRDTFGTEAAIVACTVHLNEISKVRDAGFNGFISKPLDQKRFPGQVKRLLQGEEVWEL